MELEGLWPGRFEKKHGRVGGDGFKTWLRTLKGLTPDQLNRGLEKHRCSGTRFPPDPAEFRALCQRAPHEMGLPEPRQAFVMMARKDWSQPIVWHAAQRGAQRGVGVFELNSRSERETWPEFQRLYAELVMEADQGRVFEVESRGVPAISHEPVAAPGTEYGSAEEARAEMLRRFGRQRAQ